MAAAHIPEVPSAAWDTHCSLPALCVYPMPSVFLLTPIPGQAGALPVLHWDLGTGTVGHQDVFSHESAPFWSVCRAMGHSSI